MTPPVELDAALADFVTYLRAERGAAAQTIKAYQRDLSALIEGLRAAGLSDWRDCDDMRLRSFFAGQHRRGLDPRSIARGMSATRAFFRFLQLDGRIAHNPARQLRPPRQATRLPKMVDAERLGAALDQGAQDPLLLRDLALMELIYSTALRLHEVLALDLDDVQGGQSLLQIVGKGGYGRVVPIGSKASAALQRYLPQRPHCTSTALFVSRQGQRLSARSAQQRIRQLSRQRGLGALSPHALRHACASHLLQSSGDLRAVQEMLGHRSITTTQIYTRLDLAALQNKYDSAHPLARDLLALEPEEGKGE